MSRIYRRTIDHFEGSWGSGLATLVFTDGTVVDGDNGPMVRGLDAALGGAIGPGHSVDNTALKGREVVYGVDDMMGLLDGVMAAEDYTGPDIPAGGLEVGGEDE